MTAARSSSTPISGQSRQIAERNGNLGRQRTLTYGGGSDCRCSQLAGADGRIGSRL